MVRGSVLHTILLGLILDNNVSFTASTRSLSIAFPGRDFDPSVIVAL